MTPAAAGRVGLVIVAAGSGERLGSADPKAFVTLNGRSLLRHALQRLHAAAHEVVVVAPAGQLERATDEAAAEGLAVTVVTGGATRSASVSAGLAALGPHDLVAVHDAARPLVEADALLRAAAAVREGADAAAPAVRINDTIKRVDGDVVKATLDRSVLRAVQTPQVFRREVLLRAHAAGGEATDDLALVERDGGKVVLVEGSHRYLKITFPDDLVLAATLEAM